MVKAFQSLENCVAFFPMIGNSGRDNFQSLEKTAALDTRDARGKHPHTMKPHRLEIQMTAEQIAKRVDDLVTEQMIGYADGVYRIDVRRLPEQICALYFDQKVLGVSTDRSFRIRLAKLLDLAP